MALVAAENRKGAQYVEDLGESRRTVANGKTGFTSRKKAVRFFVEGWTCNGTESDGDRDRARCSDLLNRATEEPPPYVEVFRK
jgi:hypothetical protein